MPDHGLTVKEVPDGVVFKVRIQPRSSKNIVAGVMGDCLKIKVTSPPVDGEANAACIAFIANLLDLPKDVVTIAAGYKSRTKIIKVNGVGKNNFFAVLAPYI